MTNAISAAKNFPLGIKKRKLSGLSNKNYGKGAIFFTKPKSND
jgi:hypothetical protein